MGTIFRGTAMWLAFLPSIALGDSRGTCEKSFETPFRTGGELQMHLRSGDIDIKGTDTDKIVVSCDLQAFERAGDVRIGFRSAGKSGTLRVSGGPTSNFHVRIEVPRNTHLFVRSPAGDLKMSGVVGNKDVEMHAGDLTIAVGRASDYSHADGSVLVGDLVAPAFAINKDGLFRSFEKDNRTGKYRLHAHVGAGEVILR